MKPRNETNLAQVSHVFDDYNCMRLINNRMACSGNLVKIALGQLQNVKIALATLRQFFYIFHLTLSNFPQIALQSMRLLVHIICRDDSNFPFNLVNVPPGAIHEARHSKGRMEFFKKRIKVEYG